IDRKSSRCEWEAALELRSGGGYPNLSRGRPLERRLRLSQEEPALAETAFAHASEGGCPRSNNEAEATNQPNVFSAAPADSLRVRRARKGKRHGDAVGLYPQGPSCP